MHLLVDFTSVTVYLVQSLLGPDTCGEESLTPLHCAAAAGSLACVQLLTGAGAKLNAYSADGR